MKKLLFFFLPLFFCPVAYPKFLTSNNEAIAKTTSILMRPSILLFSYDCSKCLDTHPIQYQDECLSLVYLKANIFGRLKELLLVYNSCSNDNDRMLVLDMIAGEGPEFALTALKYISKSSNNPDTLNIHLNNLIEEILLTNPEKLHHLDALFSL